MMRRATLLALVLIVTPLLADETKIEKPTVEFIESPNFSPMDRGKGTINYVIIHTTEGTKKSCINWFKNKKSEVSAHYVIGHDGTITQMVKDKDRAWHAGVKLYNAEGIGIEHEGHAAKNEWTEKQLRASADLTRWLCKEYGIPIDRKHIMGHQEIAPGRKSDPGPYFKWDLYLELVKDPKTKIDLGAKDEKKSDEKKAESDEKKADEKADPEK